MGSNYCAPCILCVKLAKWLPVLFIFSIVFWSYYAYVIELCIKTIDVVIQKVLYMLIFHFILALFLWAYWQTIVTETGRVPKQFILPPSDLEIYLNAETEDLRRDALNQFCERQNLPVVNRTLTGDIRYCDKCCQIKPDRSHHCSVCGACVLKMDHHCPWVNNCVSFTNYKYFILFLGYALIYCVFIALTTLEFFIKFWTATSNMSNKFHVLFLFFVAMMFGLCLMSLFGYHVFLVIKNRSTVESFRSPIFYVNRTWIHDKEGFSLGAYNNFIEIFGDNKKHWFLPLFTSLGDGASYPTKGGPSASLCTITTHSNSKIAPQPTSYGSTQTSLGDGVTYPQRCVEEDMDGLLNSGQRWSDEDENNTMNGGHQLSEIRPPPNALFQV